MNVNLIFTNDYKHYSNISAYLVLLGIRGGVSASRNDGSFSLSSLVSDSLLYLLEGVSTLRLLFESDSSQSPEEYKPPFDRSSESSRYTGSGMSLVFVSEQAPRFNGERNS